MLQYLVILLDDTSISYCHYKNKCKERNLIPLNVLHEGIVFGMKENMMIQFVYPNYELPQDYKDEIESIDHSNIIPSNLSIDDADVVVYNDVTTLISKEGDSSSQSVVLRISKEHLFENIKEVASVLDKTLRLNLVITDIEIFNDDDYNKYKNILAEWSDALFDLYAKGDCPQFNLLTDRMMLESMNNCRAGDNSITLAPDGQFYVCPAFYQVDESDDYGLGRSKFCIGSLKEGLNIKNSQLYNLEFAPICRECDAYHCKRCIWLNRNLTYEVNTPSKQQCVIAHIERNASRKLLNRLQKELHIMQPHSIKEIDYLDPFDKLINKTY